MTVALATGLVSAACAGAKNEVDAERQARVSKGTALDSPIHSTEPAPGAETTLRTATTRHRAAPPEPPVTTTIVTRPTPATTPGLPNPGRYVYDIVETDRTAYGTFDKTFEPHEDETPVTVTAPDQSTRKLLYDYWGPVDERQYVKTSAGAILWSQSDFKRSQCDWEPDLIYLPGPAPQPGTTWQTSASCPDDSGGQHSYELRASASRGESGLIRIHRSIHERATGQSSYDSTTEIDDDYSPAVALVLHWISDNTITSGSGAGALHATKHTEATLRS